MHSEVAQVVLCIPEPLSLIFRYVDKTTLAASAIVCRAWLNPALNELWRCLDDPLVLLRLLSPMHTVNAGLDCIPHVRRFPSREGEGGGGG